MSQDEALNEKEINTPENEIPAEMSTGDNKEIPDYLDQLKRLQAEFINYKRRMEKMQTEWSELSVRNVMNELLPIIDDFDYLFLHNVDDQNHLPMDGVKMIYEKLFGALQKLGLKDVETENVQFNPEFHEAVRMEKRDDVKPGEILQVWQRGFKMNDKLLRPARVMVAEANESE